MHIRDMEVWRAARPGKVPDRNGNPVSSQLADQPERYVGRMLSQAT